jgi:hypothetical protein
MATENPARRKRAMLLAFSSRKEGFDVINEDLAAVVDDVVSHTRA